MEKSWRWGLEEPRIEESGGHCDPSGDSGGGQVGTGETDRFGTPCRPTPRPHVPVAGGLPCDSPPSFAHPESAPTLEDVCVVLGLVQGAEKPDLPQELWEVG